MPNATGAIIPLDEDHSPAADTGWNLSLENFTVDVENGEVVRKEALKLPEKLTDVIKCKNPRCITTIEEGMSHMFYLADDNSELYRCSYCQNGRTRG